MMKEPTHRRIDTTAFTRAGQNLRGRDTVQDYERLMQELPAQASASALQLPITWEVSGELRSGSGGGGLPWLHLKADVTLPLQCQRCLQPVAVKAEVDRFFRLVTTEAMAEAEDDESEEDLLVGSAEFELDVLIEDELLMSLPLVPRHDICPTEVVLAVEDGEFAAALAEKPNPFAVLQQLKRGGDQ